MISLKNTILLQNFDLSPFKSYPLLTSTDLYIELNKHLDMIEGKDIKIGKFIYEIHTINNFIKFYKYEEDENFEIKDYYFDCIMDFWNYTDINNIFYSGSEKFIIRKLKNKEYVYRTDK